MNKPIILVIGMLLLWGTTFGQGSSQLRTANQKFEERNYTDAIRFYKDALKETSADIAFAQFQLGNCYRFLLDYPTAEYHYKEAVALNDRRYPFARFHYASMLKQNGKYEQALPEFETFIVDIEAYFDDNENARIYFNQAKNEREGCILALTALSTPKPDYNLTVLPSPVNTDYNDFGATFYGSENEIYVTSAKKNKKGAIIGGRFGETYADIYGYSFSGSKWVPLKGKNLVDGVVNQKLGEAAGAFNADKTKFYYTKCDEAKGFCIIELAIFTNGKWDIKKLGRNVNAPGTTSKHPALSPSGDTLYFSSNRAGGLGQMDLWMSISSDGVNWSAAKNLGKEINTPLDELSPYFDGNTGKLFFASTGHRGFGGYDIYLASGQNLDKMEIYNLGYPFNSNKDDLFAVFGKTRGFISSNRNGGPGKFDVYSFDIGTQKRVFAEISVDPAIAGRNAMFSDDFEFESNQITLIKDLVSISLAAKLQGVDLILPSNLQGFYDRLSIEDRGKIERIVNSRYRRVTEEELNELELENEYFFMTSSEANKEHIRHMATKYVEEAGLSDNIDYDSVDMAFLDLLSESDRRKVEQFVLNKARRARDHQISAANYNKLDNKDKKGVDNIAVQFIKEKKSLDQLTLSVDNNIFLKQLNADKRKDIVQSIRDKMLLLADDERFKLTDADKEFYNNLSHDHLESIKHIAHSFLLSDAEHLSQFLEKGDLEYYNVLGGNQKAIVDRIIAKIIRNTYLSDILYTETSSMSKTDIQDLQDDISGANSLSEMLASVSPNAVASSLNTRDKNRLVRFLSSGGAREYLKRPDNIFTMDEDVVTEEYAKLQEKNPEETNKRIFPITFGKPVASISTGGSTGTPTGDIAAKTYTNGLEVSNKPTENITRLDPQTIDFYEGLSDQDQLKIDRFIGARYINRDYAQSSIINADIEFESNLIRAEKSHIKLLSKSLKEDAMDRVEKEAVKASFVFYDNKATNAKPKWNRLILSYGLDIDKNGSYLAKRKDYAFYESLTDTEKGYVKQLEDFRNTNHRILTDNLREDATDVVVPNLVRNIPKYIVKTDKMSIEGELIDNQDGTAVEAFSVALENDKGTKVYQTNTNEKGEFAFKSIETDEYKLVSADDRYDEKFAKDYFIKDLKITEVEADVFRNLINTNIFFDSDSKALRREAVVTLDEIAKAYQDGRFLVELDSHTDNEGNKDYNEALSLERGNATKSYLVSKGVDNGDVVMRFFGSDKPVAPNDNVYGKQFNRRVDIRIKATSGSAYNPPVVYLAQPTVDFKKLASRYQISDTRLRALNGLNSNELAAFKPVRLPNINISPDLSQVVPLNTNVMIFTSYLVKAGETVTSIADKLRIPEELIYELNNLASDKLEAGSKLIIVRRTK